MPPSVGCEFGCWLAVFQSLVGCCTDTAILRDTSFSEAYVLLVSRGSKARKASGGKTCIAHNCGHHKVDPLQVSRIRSLSVHTESSLSPGPRGAAAVRRGARARD